VLAGFDDGRAHEGVAAGPATLEGLRLARARGWEAPEPGRDRRRSAQSADELGPVMASSQSTARRGVTSSHDAPAASPGSDRGGTTAGKPPADATDGTADSGGGTTPRPRTDEGSALKDDTPGDGAEG
jgi:NADH-quinone oxidoreductase subunit E